ncbi:tetratricopeptide repeat protein [Parabacteroides sp. OttesenSCG-928-G07]|nr:tetratricopeptide repeat protein [Parabacteroides sp. OttesenSCG-928-G21]MDL2278763.1 tetratricopeptide repeat protein [Parabacteroides sp. OttesenSCG-928-G07]
MKKWILALLISVGTITISEGQTYQEWIDRSYDYLEQERLEDAEECLRNAMRLEPGNPVNYALLGNLGTIQRRQGKIDEALLSYTAALSRRPNDITLLNNRALLYTEINDIDKAIIDYTVLLMEEPEHQEALYRRGLLYLQQRNWLLAEDDFEKLLDISKESIRGLLGHAILEKLRGNFDDSEQIYNHLITRMPEELSFYEGRAELYFLMGKNARAMADVSKVFVGTAEPTAALYLLRGKIKLAQYENKTAVEDFQKALELGYDPEIVAELMQMAK